MIRAIRVALEDTTPLISRLEWSVSLRFSSAERMAETRLGAIFPLIGSDPISVASSELNQLNRSITRRNESINTFPGETCLIPPRFAD